MTEVKTPKYDHSNVIEDNGKIYRVCKTCGNKRLYSNRGTALAINRTQGDKCSKCCPDIHMITRKYPFSKKPILDLPSLDIKERAKLFFDRLERETMAESGSLYHHIYSKYTTKKNITHDNS